jgi:hypothetical protein
MRDMRYEARWRAQADRAAQQPEALLNPKKKVFETIQPVSPSLPYSHTESSAMDLVEGSKAVIP